MIFSVIVLVVAALSFFIGRASKSETTKTHYEGERPATIWITHHQGRAMFLALKELYFFGYNAGWQQQKRHAGVDKTVGRTHDHVKHKILNMRVLPKYQAAPEYER